MGKINESNKNSLNFSSFHLFFPLNVLLEIDKLTVKSNDDYLNILEILSINHLKAWTDDEFKSPLEPNEYHETTEK